MLITPKTALQGLLATALSPWWGSQLPLVGASSGAGDDNVVVGLSAETGRHGNESLLWGPYKPNLYFGVRPRTPDGVWTGLMWSKFNDPNDLSRQFRYTCEQNEGIHGYGWDEYDARSGGVQTIHDTENQIDITISFVKLPTTAKSGSWAARIKGVPRPGAPSDHVTLLHYYFAQDGLGDFGVSEKNMGDRFGFTSDLLLKGRSEALGQYTIRMTQGKGDHPRDNHAILGDMRREDRIVVQTLNVPDEVRWNAKHVTYYQIREPMEWVQKNLKDGEYPAPWLMYALPHRPGTGNAHIVQRTFRGPWEFDVVFQPAGDSQVDEAGVTSAIESVREQFANRFPSVFSFKAPFDTDKYVQFGKSMFSNLLGGIGYFHGKHLVDRSYAPEYDEEDEGFWVDAAAARARRLQKLEGPYELFTSIPSRPFFPRGFLWDEGFHLLPIADWDVDLALDVVQSWFSLMDEDGWIAREQILGDEARSKVPEEFQVQYPHYANPPTLFFIVNAFVDRLVKSDDKTAGTKLLRKLYPQLRKHYDWIRRSQAGDIKSYDREAFSTREGYRWRGRTETHILTSGLDDYPRAQPPHPGELHVDLMSWVGLMTGSLARVADILNLEDDVDELNTRLHAIKRNLNDLHWSEEEGCFCDATIDAFEENALVCHKGYVSLFPFLLGLLEPDDVKTEKVLDMIADKNHLWSPHGLRSLSKSDPLYGTAENYWRSPIWININYLALAALENLARQNGPLQKRAADLHAELRRNVVSTIHASWEKTGFAWEQYDPVTGKGQRTQHFTGWTSLVVKIMTMEEISVAEPPLSEPAVPPMSEDDRPLTDAAGDDSPAPDEDAGPAADAGEDGDGGGGDGGVGGDSGEDQEVLGDEAHEKDEL
jgi:mannosyl-oligosaccharide glucosidase